ncbi:hypothetical protein HLH17_09310 [Acinetobacter sp. ANC 5380]|uniref:Uncharacterized protein n=1 Tax=Acinetobacter terrae TaxID=2731247 RepID=A0A7Y2WB32_9GAMM|nr:hypothetical protein [Acinetobacter terrae]NNH77854.1 hypothetical protein [Acinetobacter terrae]
MTLSIQDITQKIVLMNEGKKVFYRLDQFASQDALNRTYKFLSDNRFDLGIKVDEHRESSSGHRNIDVIIVTKR